MHFGSPFDPRGNEGTSGKFEFKVVYEKNYVDGINQILLEENP